jgi:two-component system nitrate/nitrite response regulator NarL
MPTGLIVPTFILQSDGLFREGLRVMLRRTRFRPQGCGIELDDLTGVPSDRPTLFIVGTEQKQDLICKKIRSRYPLSFIVAISDRSNPNCLTGALDDGANAALFSSITRSALVSSLHAVMNRELTVIDASLWPQEIQPKANEQVSPPIQNDTPWEADNEPHAAKQFSPREIAIFQRVVRGDSNKHVALFFKIAEPTVKAHVKAIFRKIRVSNRTQAAAWALNHGLFVTQNGTEPGQESAPVALDVPHLC